MTRAETIRVLLERWHDVNDPTRTGDRGDRGLVLMPHEFGCRVFVSAPPRCTCYRSSVAEIERLLREMREGDEEVREARSQLIERYVRCRVVIHEVRRPMLDKHGRTRRNKGGVMTEPVRQIVTIYDARVEEETLQAGVLWLAWAWGLPGEPVLPGDLRRHGRAA